jgi:hypothetical protein
MNRSGVYKCYALVCVQMCVNIDIYFSIGNLFRCFRNFKWIIWDKFKWIFFFSIIHFSLKTLILKGILFTFKQTIFEYEAYLKFEIYFSWLSFILIIITLQTFFKWKIKVFFIYSKLIDWTHINSCLLVVVYQGPNMHLFLKKYWLLIYIFFLCIFLY